MESPSQSPQILKITHFSVFESFWNQGHNTFIICKFPWLCRETLSSSCPHPLHQATQVSYTKITELCGHITNPLYFILNVCTQFLFDIKSRRAFTDLAPWLNEIQYYSNSEVKNPPATLTDVIKESVVKYQGKRLKPRQTISGKADLVVEWEKPHRNMKTL